MAAIPGGHVEFGHFNIMLILCAAAAAAQLMVAAFLKKLFIVGGSEAFYQMSQPVRVAAAPSESASSPRIDAALRKVDR